MVDLSDITNFEKRQSDSTYVVSVWHIPNNTDYTTASVRHIFYSNEKDAAEFVEKWKNPPEMAMMMTIHEYDEMTSTLCSR